MPSPSSSARKAWETRKRRAAGKKAARKRKRSAAAKKAWETRRSKKAPRRKVMKRKARARKPAPKPTPVSTEAPAEAPAAATTPTPPQKRLLDEAKVAQIRDAVLRYGSVNPSRFQVPFYSFSKEERKKRGLHGLAYFDPLDGSINVEVPEIEKIRNDECLAFVFLHELAHFDGVRDEEEATNLAVESLREANILSEDRIDDLRRRWNSANDSEVLRKEADSILERAGRDPKRLSVEDLEEAVDEASTNLLCGST